MAFDPIRLSILRKGIGDSSVTLWLVFFFTCFSSLPHWHSLRHFHASSGSHSHTLTSLHEANLERSTVAALPESNQREMDLESQLGSTQSETEAAEYSLGAGERGWANPNLQWHSHFISDPNILAIAILWFLLWFCLGTVRIRPRVTPKIPLLRILAATARGPPASFPSFFL